MIGWILREGGVLIDGIDLTSQPFEWNGCKVLSEASFCIHIEDRASNRTEPRTKVACDDIRNWCPRHRLVREAQREKGEGKDR